MLYLRFVFSFSNFQNMDKVEKGPKEIFSPDIQKVRKHASLFIILLYSSIILLWNILKS